MFSCSNRDKRDSIRISVAYEIDTLDPHARTRLANYTIAFNMYEPLVTADPNMKIRPCLASRWENPDGYTWIFHLQPSVHFHSGKLLTSDDVVYSFQRVLNSPDLEVGSQLANVTEVKALDTDTVQIRTKRPLTIFLNKLFFIVIVPKGSTSQTLADKADGTGPYKLSRWNKGQSIEMIRNENYWGEKPILKEATFILGRDSNEALNDLMSNSSQLIQCNSKIVQQRLDKKKYDVLIHDGLFVKYLAYDLFRDVTPYCNTKTNPFKNIYVRQALNCAIDRNSVVAGLPSYAIPATQPIPPFVFGYNPHIQLQPYDPQQARSLLAKAGYPDGFSATLHVRQILKDTAIVLQKQLAMVGVRTELKILSDAQWFDAISKNDFSFFLSRLGATIGDASDVLDGSMHTEDASNHYGALNFGKYANAEVDRLTEVTAGIEDMEKRRTALQDTMSKIMNDLPWIPLYVDQDVYALNQAYSWQPRLDSHILAAEIKLRQ
ncbi:MAG: hypothetical protein C5B54_07525 [Acidobacteria bacterium]|nr:MAG: hypothetical protein C5B54_07525 [Acidobacteriota bacterium]